MNGYSPPAVWCLCINMKQSFNDPHPDILYKYRDWNNLNHKRIITDLKIFFPSCKKLNDPFDCKIPIFVRNIRGKKQEIKTVISKHVQKDYSYLTRKQRREKEREIYKEKNFSNYLLQEKLQYDIIDRKFGIFSLSADPKNQKLWSLYANSHKGICIGFDIEIIFKLEDIKNKLKKAANLFQIKKVNYIAEFPKWELPNQDNLLEQIITKSTDWEYEQEYRLIALDKPNWIYKIPKNAIREIIFGLKTLKKTRTEIMKEINKNNINIKFYEIIQKPDNFELSCKEINED